MEIQNFDSKLILREGGSFFIGNLSTACQMCGEGGKMVLLITGKCRKKCFYCPLSDKKIGRDVIYANEKNVESIEEILEEAELMEAVGTGITGGEPLEVLERVIKYIKIIKKVFGIHHNIHMYTSKPPSEPVLVSLKEAGLDEIRYHIPPEKWRHEKLAKSQWVLAIENAKGLDLKVSIEVPCIPDMHEGLLDLCYFAEQYYVDHINLNELEINHVNFEAMINKGYFKEVDYLSKVKGSKSTAIRVLNALSSDSNGLNIHFCSARFKDSVQLKKRLGRRAVNIKKPFQEITEDNTLLTGIIECPPTKTNIDLMKSRFDIPDEMINADPEGKYTETAWYIVKEIWPYIEYRCAVIETYPTHDRMEVERELLGSDLAENNQSD